MIARIIVDNRSKQVDKFFDYLIPEELENAVTVGSRVIVPFSRGNTELEGFCIGTTDKSAAKKLKSIIRVLDLPRAFDEEMLEVIEWMHDKYLASYLDIIHAIAPAGSAVKGEGYVRLINEYKSQSDTINKIQNIISQNGGKMDVSELSKAFDKDIKPQIRNMIKQGILEKEFKYISAVSKKTVRCVRLAVSEDIAEAALLKLPKNASVQKKMIKTLIASKNMTTSNLIKMAGGTSETIAALVKKGLAEVYLQAEERNPLENKIIPKSQKLTPTEEQRLAIDKINGAICHNYDEVFLLHGVTGSGKTEVFLQSIDCAVSNNKTALVLVPEISLTPQMVNRFVSRFGKRVAILHSGLSLGERYDQWQRIYDGKADIVIGARSAVFAPLKNIGIIIIDEEHSDTYKSENSPRYQTYEVAIKRARQYGAAVVLASATPKAESMHKAKNGEYTYIPMKNRYNKNVMPRIEIVDMRRELEMGNKSMFSKALEKEIRENLSRGEQTILFLNRRGFSTFVSCRSCGYVPKCPHCSISLTYHRYGDVLKCHYCGYTHANYKICPNCNSKYIRYFGGGTQRVETEIKKLFPKASVLRMDVDTTGKKQSHEQILEHFVKDKVDILIGTQMVAKGLDFENVTLVGVISADTMLHISDYRSRERTFSMLEQVTGRAGRGEKTGRAVIQTYDPDNEAVSLVKRHDYNAFYESEIMQRKLMWYPPYSDIICVMFLAPTAALSQQTAKYFMKFLVDLKQQTQILGPLPDAISKMKNKYRYRIIIKCDDSDKLNKVLKKAETACKKHKDYGAVSVIIDKDPNMIS